MRKRTVFMLLFSIFFIFQSRADSKLPIEKETIFLNNKVLDFAKNNLGKKVGRGECWDLAAVPLKRLSAKWDKRFKFGKKIAWGNNSTHKTLDNFEILPGDIIQFKNVIIKETWKRGNSFGSRTQVFGAPNHTAIIGEIENRYEFALYHQNINGKRFVLKDRINLNNMKSGNYIIYRAFKY